MSSVSELDAGGGGVSRVSREDTPSLSPAPPVSDTVTTPKGGEKSAGSIEAAGKHDLAQNLPPNAARVANADGGVRVSGSGNELSTEHDPAASVPNAASVTGRPGATNETADTDKTNAQAPATRRGRHRRGGGSRGARAGGALSTWGFDDPSTYTIGHTHDVNGNPTVSYQEYTAWVGAQMADLRNDSSPGHQSGPFNRFDPRHYAAAHFGTMRGASTGGMSPGGGYGGAAYGGYDASAQPPFTPHGGNYGNPAAHRRGEWGPGTGYGVPGGAYNQSGSLPQMRNAQNAAYHPGHNTQQQQAAYQQQEWEAHARLVAATAGGWYAGSVGNAAGGSQWQNGGRQALGGSGWGLPPNYLPDQRGGDRVGQWGAHGNGQGMRGDLPGLDQTGGAMGPHGNLFGAHPGNVTGNQGDPRKPRLHTVHVRDVHESVTEGDIAEAFADCGDVADCRLCADPQGGSRYAFVAFHTKLAARAALAKSGEPIGGHSVRVVLSRTSVVPVNPSLLPQTSDEVERCARTIYVANVDRGTSDGEVLDFFTTNAGPVLAVLLQENPRVASRVAFVEFGEVEGARAALKCGGRSLNGRAVRVSQSKTPLRAGGAKQAGFGTPGNMGQLTQRNQGGAAAHVSRNNFDAQSPAASSPSSFGTSSSPNKPTPPTLPAPPGQRTNWRESLRSAGAAGGSSADGSKMFHAVRVANVPASVTESALARVFSGCGRVLDCRMAGDSNSDLRVAFVAFDTETGVDAAVHLDGFLLQGVALAVRKSATPVVAVNPDLLPRSESDLERCTRTVHVAHIGLSVTALEVRFALENACGGQIENMHQQRTSGGDTQVAFVEFRDASVAQAALNVSGLKIGANVVWISPSKTHLKRHPAVRKKNPEVAPRIGSNAVWSEPTPEPSASSDEESKSEGAEDDEVSTLQKQEGTADSNLTREPLAATPALLLPTAPSLPPARHSPATLNAPTWNERPAVAPKKQVPGAASFADAEISRRDANAPFPTISFMEAEIQRLDALAVSSAAYDAVSEEVARRKSHDSVRSGSSEGDTAVA